MAEQPMNLSTAIYLGVFSRAEQRVLQAIFKAIAEGGDRYVATLAKLVGPAGQSKRRPSLRAIIRKSVVLDFVNPLGAGGQRVGFGTKARRNDADREVGRRNMAGEHRERPNLGQGRAYLNGDVQLEQLYYASSTRAWRTLCGRARRWRQFFFC